VSGGAGACHFRHPHPQSLCHFERMGKGLRVRANLQRWHAPGGASAARPIAHISFRIAVVTKVETRIAASFLLSPAISQIMEERYRAVCLTRLQSGIFFNCDKHPQSSQVPDRIVMIGTTHLPDEPWLNALLDVMTNKR
jgi:hypothetical protein